MSDTLLHLSGKASATVSPVDSAYNVDEPAHLPGDESSQCRAAVLRQVGYLTNQLIELLEARFSEDDNQIQTGLDFLRNYLESTNRYLVAIQDYKVNQSVDKSCDTALSRLAHGLNLSLIDIQMLILAGMAQEHEGFANLFYSLHPSQQSFPTPALLAQLVCEDAQERQILAVSLNQSALLRFGVLELAAQVPIFTRSIILNANYWHVLNTGKANFLQQSPVAIHACFEGLQHWLQEEVVDHAKQCISKQFDSQIIIHSSDNAIGLNRALALLDHTQCKSLVVHVNESFSQSDFHDLACQSVMSAAIPILLIDNQQSVNPLDLASLNQICKCVIICTTSSINMTESNSIKVDLSIQRLANTDVVQMWQTLLPEFASRARQLASWFPLDPYQAMQRVNTWRSLHPKEHQKSSLSHLSKVFKQYSGAVLPQGIKRVTPGLGWSDLVLPELKLQQLRDAIDRLKLQHKVLDEWQFLHNRRGAKGVRLLFSGVPGTGKTLSAEVLANELQVDLLIVDLAAVVSKWVGETEKNLAKVFSFAEQSQAVLLFDEADAIFGRRTEVNDSHDRYANLETAYLLTRLEAYDGMTILATNFRNNIDVAFIRRLDFIVDFREPNVSDREHLWRCHVPKTAPINPDVNFTQLATLFPLVGGEIRNAAVAAAYYAAQQQQVIQQEHFIMAIRKEFEKTGKAFREVNPL